LLWENAHQGVFKMMRLFIPILALSFLACSGYSYDSTDSSEDTGLTPDFTGTRTDSSPTDSSTPRPSDSAPPADSPADSPVDSDIPEPDPYQLAELSDPCGGAGTPYAMYFEDSLTGWVGCGNGIGLYKSFDGGESFEDGHFSTWTGDLYILEITPDPSGGLLFCGHDYSYASTLIYRYKDGEWSDLLHYGANWNDPTSTQFSNCGVVAAAGDDTILTASNTIGDISWSQNNGQTWTAEERYWEDANLYPNGYSAYQMLNLLSAGGKYYGAGSVINEPPVFLGPSQHPDGQWYNFHATIIDPTAIGEIWALATPDDGTTFFAGGRDQRYSDRASGFFYQSQDGGQSWSKVELAEELDIMHDIEFAADGLHGIAVGHRYPPASLGGYILLTEDGGVSWMVLETEVPPLYTAAIVDTSWWVAGDGFLMRGSFPVE
jgi:hypothetical protein